jgi:predicted nucleic acid-binding protein
LKREIPEQPIGLIDIILCEVLQGVRTDAQFRRVRSDLMEFDVFDSGGVALAVASAENYRNLRARGFTIRKTIDCLIATFCIEEGHALLHHDRDFDPFEEHLGLRVIHAQPLHA